MSVAGSAAYRVEAIDPARERETILALWRSGLEQSGRPEAKFDWYYRENPGGPPLVLMLRVQDDGQPVGVASLGHRVMRRAGEPVPAGALADFVVIPEHRNFFPALHLQRALRRSGLGERAIVFGLPNARSEPVVRRVGYRRIGDYVRYARAVRVGAYLGRVLPAPLGHAVGALVDPVRRSMAGIRGGGAGLRAKWSEGIPEGVDALWEKASRAPVLMGVRDARFLEWRFARCPLYSYRFLSIATPDGEIAAYAACRDHGESLQVDDFLIDPGAPRTAARLWLEISEEAYRRGHRSTSVEFLGGGAALESIHAAGWVARPERRALWAAFAGEEITDPAQWYVTAADEDA